MALAGNYLFAIRDDNSSTIPSQATTLLRMNLQTGEVEEDFLSESFFQADTEDFLYGIDYDTEKSELYISFATGGKGFRLNPFSQIVGNFPTGNYPRKILFYR
jgi:hypothetical protein